MKVLIDILLEWFSTVTLLFLFVIAFIALIVAAHVKVLNFNEALVATWFGQITRVVQGGGVYIFSPFHTFITVDWNRSTCKHGVQTLINHNSAVIPCSVVQHDPGHVKADLRGGVEVEVDVVYYSQVVDPRAAAQYAGDAWHHLETAVAAVIQEVFSAHSSESIRTQSKRSLSDEISRNLAEQVQFKEKFGIKITNFAVQDILFPDDIKNADTSNERARLEKEAAMKASVAQEESARALAEMRHLREVKEAEAGIKIAQLHAKRDAVTTSQEAERLAAIANAVGRENTANVIWALAAFAASAAGNAFQFRDGFNFMGLNIPKGKVKNAEVDAAPQDSPRGGRRREIPDLRPKAGL